MDATPRAAEYLTLLLERFEAAGDQGLRLFPEDGGGLGVALETLNELDPGDQVLRNEERAILVLDPGLAMALSEATLDCASTPEGERLVLDLAS